MSETSDYEHRVKEQKQLEEFYGWVDQMVKEGKLVLMPLKILTAVTLWVLARGGRKGER